MKRIVSLLLSLSIVLGLLSVTESHVFAEKDSDEIAMESSKEHAEYIEELYINDNQHDIYAASNNVYNGFEYEINDKRKYIVNDIKIAITFDEEYEKKVKENQEKEYIKIRNFYNSWQ